jgi:pectin methylesterase-like acyl-CoA thioesterase
MKKVFSVLMLLMLLGFTFSGSAVTKKTFDFVLGVNGDFKAAVAAAGSASGSRFYIFFPDGEYNIGTLSTADTNQMTTFTAANVSFVGQSADKTIIFNKSINEAISTTATLYFKNSDNLYMQDLTILNKANYGDPSTYSATGRHVAICEESDNVVYKNVKILSTQDSYYTKGTKTYWEDGEIHGTTDFICGKGDVFFSKCLIWTDKVSSITAPDGSVGSYGYVFSNCTIDGTVSGFTLGRAWKQSAKCVYINTTMKKLPSDEGWANPINTGITTVLLAEYNSKQADGTAVDVSKRKSSFSKDGTSTATCNPVLTASEAAKYTVDGVFGSWKPNLLTTQIAAPVASKSGLTLKWDDNTNALCWVVFKDGKYFKCVTTPSVEMTSGSGEYTVRAANEMGGLGASSNAVNADGTPVVTSTNLTNTCNYSVQPNTSVKNLVSITIPSNAKGATLNIIAVNGRVLMSRILDNEHFNLQLDNVTTGSYIFEIVDNSSKKVSFTQSVTLY